jgi:hypothetical protein
MVGTPRDGQVRDVVLNVRLTAAEIVLVDRLRGRGVTRSAYVRNLLHQAARRRAREEADDEATLAAASSFGIPRSGIPLPG